MIYFSIIGTHDTLLDSRDPHTTSGAALTIFMKYKEEIDTVYLFTTKTGDGNEQTYKNTADKIEKVFKSESSKIKLTQIELDFTPSPIDYDIVYHEMLNKISMIMDGNSVVRDADKIINITKKKLTDLVAVTKDRIGKDESYHLNTKKIKKELNWRAKIDLHTGLVKTLTWVDKNLNILKKEKPNYVHKK